MDAPRQVAHLGDRVLRRRVRGVEQSLRLGRIAALGEFLLGQPDVHRKRDQTRLRAVVQIALDAAQRRRRVVHRDRARLLEFLDPLVAPGRSRAVPRTSTRSTTTTPRTTHGAASRSSTPATRDQDDPERRVERVVAAECRAAMAAPVAGRVARQERPPDRVGERAEPVA